MQQAAYAHEPSTERGRERRNQIIAVATELFHERGFHATGIDDIGAAAGITGPGIYRHFTGKDEILIAVFDRIWMMLKEAIDSSHELDGVDSLDYLIARHVRLSVEHRAEFALLAHDLKFLPSSYRAMARTNRATYRDRWVEVIVSVRPSVSVEEARLMTGAAWKLSSAIGDTIDESGLSRSRLESVLVSMTQDAVLGGGSDV